MAIGKKIVGTLILLFISGVMKNAFYDSLCSINAFACFVGFVAYVLPTLIVLVYWINKLIDYVEPYLER